jgi:transcriptional regulator with XRE-family HTH domain
MAMSRQTFADWLRQRRHLLDLKQVELAQQTGCSAVTVRKLGAGERKPSAELAQALAVSLRIPQREQAAFIQFARADELNASFRLPAWNAEQVSWRSGQLPTVDSTPLITSTHVMLSYDLVTPDAPKFEKVEDGRFLVKASASGGVTGDIEGNITVNLTQIIMPKPENMGYTQALPMQIGAIFNIQSGVEQLEGTYTGLLSPMLDDNGNGNAQLQATGQIISVTAGFIDLFLNYVFVGDVIRMVEGIGTGASGTMQLKPGV